MSDDQIDVKGRELIAKFSDPPTSLEILEVLDKSIFYAWASGFVIRVLEILYEQALRRENKKNEDNTPFATWRNV
jgi:hypothetical protein